MTISALLGNVGVFGLAVMICLAALSIYSVGLILDKHRRFRLASRQSYTFKSVFGKSLRAGDFQNVIDAARKNQRSYMAQVVSAGMIEYEGRQNGSGPGESPRVGPSAPANAKG